MRASAITLRSGAPVASRLLVLVGVALSALLGFAGPVAASETPTEAERVVSVVSAQVGDKYRFTATGPDEFDCSGLVWYSFRESGLADRIGDKRKTAAGYFKWFKARGLTSKSNPRPGDLIVWGRNKHIGIYVGEDKAVSALNPQLGVRRHAVKGYISMPIKAYLHVPLER